MNSWVKKPPRPNQPFLCVDLETAPQRWALAADVPIDIDRIHRDWCKLHEEHWAVSVCNVPPTPKLKALPKELREMLDDDDEAGVMPYYVDYLREHANAPLLATGVPPALHPTTGHLVSATFAFRRDRTDQVNVYRLYPDDDAGSLYDKTQTEIETQEMNFLGLVVGEISTAIENSAVIVTWNGKDFDFPFFLGRAMLLGLDPVTTGVHWSRLLYPFDNKDHADMRLIVNCDQRNARGTLDWFSKAANIPVATHGADVYGWVTRGEWAKLTEYGEEEGYTMINWWRRVRDWR